MAGTASAQETIRAASAFGPAHMNAQTTYPLIFDKLDEFTDGRYTGEDFPSGLVSPQEMLNGLQTGVADMGAVVLLYFPAAFVESTLPGEVSILGSDPYAIAAATTEYIVTCDECLAEFKKAGQVYLGSSATAPYNVLSKEEANSLDAFSKMRVRVSGAAFTSWIKSLGSTPVQMPSSEVFEAMNQGTIDATYGSVPELINAQLFDVVKYVTLTRVGVFSSDGVANVGTQLWSKLSPEDREGFAKAVQYGAAAATKAWLDNVENAMKKGKEQGIEFSEPSDELQAAKDKFIEAHLKSAEKTLADKGVSDAAAKIKRYRELIDKWHKVLDEQKPDRDALAELRFEEIWSTLDYATYGQ